jgi:hypothetical protein
MVKYPSIQYRLTVSSTLPLPVVTKGSPTRAEEAFLWDTSKLLELIHKDVGNVLPDRKKTRLVKRIQDKERRWAVINYLLWEARDREPKRITLTLVQTDFNEEFEKVQQAAELLAKRISEVLHEIDPVNLGSDAPEDEYDSEAEWIAQKIRIAGEELSSSLLREIFESMFRPGVCTDDVYGRITARLNPIIREESS